MIRLFLFLLFICALFWGYWNFLAAPDRDRPIQNISSGLVSYGKETVDTLQGNGFVSLDGTTVRSKLEVNGSLKAVDARVGFLLCNGYASLQNSIIHGSSEIKGFMSAVNTQFEGLIVATTQKIYLTDCITESITIKEAGWTIGSQSISLQGHTTVKGSIIFESNQGVIYLSEHSKILGQVIGGRIEKLS
jgi:hypothetical protein